MRILQADKDVESARIFRRDPMLTPDVQIRRPRESGNVEGVPLFLRCCCRKAKGGVQNVHTRGFGSGRTGGGLGRIAEVFAGVASLQGKKHGSSPTSGTYFPCSGACGPLSVHKLFTWGPSGGPFLLVAVAVAGVLLTNLVVVFGTCYLFIVVHGVSYMTCSGAKEALLFLQSLSDGPS
jgi:hypothetical protein